MIESLRDLARLRGQHVWFVCHLVYLDNRRLVESIHTLMREWVVGPCLVRGNRGMALWEPEQPQPDFERSLVYSINGYDAKRCDPQPRIIKVCRYLPREIPALLWGRSAVFRTPDAAQHHRILLALAGTATDRADEDYQQNRDERCGIFRPDSPSILPADLYSRTGRWAVR